MYNTVEAYLENNKLIFQDWFTPKKRLKVLVTFLEDENEYDLFEMDNKNVTKKMKDLQKKVLNKDKSLFSNI